MTNILLAGYIAIEATHKLIEKERPALSCRFSNRFLSLTDEMTSREMVSHDSIEKVIKGCGYAKNSDLDIIEISETGIFGTLWELAEANNCGLNIDLTKISIKQETVEIFEWMDVNPYTYPSKGAWLISSEDAYDLKDDLEKAGIKASVIGYETSSKDRVIINQDETRFLTPIDRLLKDEQGQKNYR